ncbi:MAG TPA: class I SAM-dependent methyltransferase [Steroidobacteraceae bacterium]|nr:class I SAM-dependent methyltransferase [Steroidobacteraceae bacterium]
MNRYHRWFCRSAGWRRTVERRIPRALGAIDLGDNVLEIGPGPGVTTDVLRRTHPRLTAIEVDAELADRLRSRLVGSETQVVTADATAMPFADGQFSGAVSFAMLHHVPTAQLQDRVLHEIRRVLAPGGHFVGSDSLQGLYMRLIHIGDTLVPLDPAGFGARLEAAGFQVLAVERESGAFVFRARRPITLEGATHD